MPASTRATRKAAERAAAIDKLRAYFPPGSTAYTILRHVSASGMTRDISVIAVVDGEPIDVSYLVARAIDNRMTPAYNHGGLRVTGAGMDMGFHVVYSMSRTLWREKLATIDALLTNRGTDAGYSVSHRWL